MEARSIPFGDGQPMPDAAISTANGRFVVRTGFRFKDLCKSIPGARWEPKAKHWYYPSSPAMAQQLWTVFGDLGLQVDGGFEKHLRQAHAVVEAAKHKIDSDPRPYRTRAHPKPWLHQRRAFWFAHDMSAVMLAMYMRSGKSRVAVDLCV